ncbi:type VII toxin-antitoxin system MntA family adenylyltransferase antitoxin [Ectobacillus panaciterrae]|uniref:type VII toxin-antitoxin system MntA family adenylyltransferase antitoxin n=1 Tax=Ectobacillus panaciterrae TaxID=363872 RepID=UPI0004208C96|nr:nucleotidyltransferase domain-containing protein [Ectobacillus panaciterrae]
MPNNNHLAVIKEFLVNKLSPYVIYLFGSQAKQQTHPDSDFDIAFISEEDFDTYERFMISQELAAILNKDVDLVDLKKASTVFQAQIITSGTVLYCSDNAKKAVFEMYTLKKYAKLNEERSEIVKNIIERGIHNE